MKKRILALALSAILGCTFFYSAMSVQASETDGVDNNQKKSLLYETDVIKQNDYEEGFRSYALSGATVDLTSKMRVLPNGEFANVVGVVKDYDTEEMVSDATISVDGNAVVTTGEDGRFQIKNIPSGTYKWKITATGYAVANYDNYDVDSADGTTIFTFYVNHE